MTTDWLPYPDLEAAVIELLSNFVSGHIDVATPADLQNECPFIRVTRGGGADDQISDTGQIHVDFFDLKRTDAARLARDSHQRMIKSPHSLSACVIDRVVPSLGPINAPWGNPDIALFTASYAVTARRTFVLS